MRGWIPVPGTTKARLVESALVAFASRDYSDVGVHELAAGGDVTVGSLYHHFTSKAGLYAVVRTDIESRTLDRMEGAVATHTPQHPLRAVDIALVGFDYLAASGQARLLATPWPKDDDQPARPDRVSTFFAGLCDQKGAPVGRLLHAAWRTALADVAEGHDARSMRRALTRMDVPLRLSPTNLPARRPAERQPSGPSRR
jgi:AcrR family transcriptional regulator